MLEKNILPRSQKPPSACDLMQAVFETLGKYFSIRTSHPVNLETLRLTFAANRKLQIFQG